MDVLRSTGFPAPPPEPSHLAIAEKRDATHVAPESRVAFQTQRLLFSASGILLPLPAGSQLMYCSRLRLNKECNINLQPVAMPAQQILNY